MIGNIRQLFDAVKIKISIPSLKLVNIEHGEK